MQNKLKLLIPLFLAIALAVYLLSNSEEAKIKKQFQSLCECVSKTPGEGNAAMGVKMLTLGRLLGDSVDVSLEGFPSNGQQSSEMLVSLATHGRGFFQEIQITPVSIEITLKNKNEATARCAVRIYLATSEKSMNETRTLQAKVQKIDKNWKFLSFREDQLLKK